MLERMHCGVLRARGRSAIRAGSPVRFTVVYGNRGNVDAVGVPLALTYPKDFLFDALFTIVAPPASAAQAIDDFSDVPIVAEVDPASDLRNIPLLLPVVLIPTNPGVSGEVVKGIWT